MATKSRITTKEKARTKKKVGLAVYFTFIATFALCFGAQLWMIDVFNQNEQVQQNYSSQPAKQAPSQTNDNNTYPLINRQPPQENSWDMHESNEDNYFNTQSTQQNSNNM